MGRTRLDAEENHGLEGVFVEQLDYRRYRHGEHGLLKRSGEEAFQRRGVELRNGGPQRCCTDGEEAWSAWSCTAAYQRLFTARVLLGDDDRQIKDLSGKHAVSGGRADDAPRPTAADPASSMETQTLASLSILLPVATTWSNPRTSVPDDGMLA